MTRREAKQDGFILARCAEILDRVDLALAAERYDETAALLAESRDSLHALSAEIRAGVDQEPRGAYADLAAERTHLQNLLQRTDGILDRCRSKRSAGLEELRLLRNEQRFCDGDLPDTGGWTDKVC